MSRQQFKQMQCIRVIRAVIEGERDLLGYREPAMNSAAEDLRRWPLFCGVRVASLP